MNFKICAVVFFAAMCFSASARPTKTELGDTVSIHADTPLETTPLPKATFDEEVEIQTTSLPTSTLEEFADVLRKAVAKVDGHPEPTSSNPSGNEVTEDGNASNVDDGRTNIQDPKFDAKNFNDIMLNAVLDAVRKQVQNSDGSFDFMAIIKQLFDIWAKRFDYNKDGEVSIAEFAQWLIQFVKEKLDQL